MVKLNFFLFLLQFFLPFVSRCQSVSKTVLVHSRYDVADTSSEMILGYKFIDGQFMKTDTLIWLKSFPGSNTESGISIGWGDEPVIRDRYLFTSKGLLIDLVERKVLRDINGDLWKVSGDKLVFSSRYYLDKTALEIYDLSEHKFYASRTLPFENKRHLVAPDLAHAVTRTYIDDTRKAVVVIDTLGKKKTVYVDTGKGPPIYPGSRASNELNVVWTDSAHFIYPIYIRHIKDGVVWHSPDSSGSTEFFFNRVKGDTLPCCSIELVEINIRTGRQRYVATINNIYAPRSNDRMFMDDGSVYFRNIGFDTSQILRIDPLNGSVTRIFPGHNEQFSLRDDSTYDRGSETAYPDNVFYNGEHIGRFFVSHFQRSGSMIAIEGRKKWDDDNSILVWSAEKRKWYTIPVLRFLSFMGWINKTGE